MDNSNSYDTNYYKDLERMLNTLVSLTEPLSTPAELEQLYEYREQREYGLAFDEIVGMIYEKNQFISQTMYDLMDKIGHQMQLEHQHWLLLRSRIKE